MKWIVLLYYSHMLPCSGAWKIMTADADNDNYD